MAKGLDSKHGYSSTLRTRRDAIKEAERITNKYGGDWCVVKLKTGYEVVHTHYLKVHNVKAIDIIKNPYRLKMAWWEYPATWFCKLFRIPMEWQAKK